MYTILHFSMHIHLTDIENPSFYMEFNHLEIL